MGRSPCCDPDTNVKKGPWMPEEDKKLLDYIQKHGCGSWRHLPKLSGLNRCGKSCRLRWTNYHRPDIKRGRFSEEEEQLIIQLHSVLGNKWSAIATRLPGRTDNEIKNYWNTNLRKKLLTMGIDPVTHRPRTDLNLHASLPNLIAAANFSNLTTDPLVNALQLPKLQLLQTLLQFITSSSPNMDAMSLLGSPFLNGSLGHQNPNLMAAGFSNPDFQHLAENLLQASMPSNLSIDGCDVVAPKNYHSCSTELGVESNGGSTTSSYITTPTTNPTPSLVSASPETGTVNQLQDQINSSDVSISSPTSTPFEAWGGLTLDDLDSDLGWKDILDQISWSDAL